MVATRSLGEMDYRIGWKIRQIYPGLRLVQFVKLQKSMKSHSTVLKTVANISLIRTQLVKSYFSFYSHKFGIKTFRKSVAPCEL